MNLGFRPLIISGSGPSAGELGHAGEVGSGSHAGEAGEGTCHKNGSIQRMLLFTVNLLLALFVCLSVCLLASGLFRMGVCIICGRGRRVAIDLKAQSRWTKQVGKGARLTFRRARMSLSKKCSGSTEVNSGVSNKTSFRRQSRADSTWPG